MKGIILWLTFLVFCSNLDPIRASSPTVCFDGLSCVHGKYMAGYDSYSFEAFLGIPYAKPPIGNLRFSNPEEAELWDGTLSALRPKPDCIQRDYSTTLKTISGSEDCLYLNIYRPLQRAGGKLPVMFYIHSGDFSSGSPSPDSVGPQYFMDTNDVILVVPAYRVGPFGFLSTNDTEMTGNYGLKDQHLALKWVNKYISAFGGDPNSVTIFGHSAGAVSVHLHLLNGHTNDSALFQNAIMMSGVANSPFAVPLSDPKGQVIKLAKAAGVSEAEYLSSAGLVQALRSIKPKTLLRAVDDLKLWNVHPLVTFRPNIENVNWPGAFLTNKQNTKNPQISIGKCHNVTWIVGNVPAKGEGLGIALRLVSDTKLQKEFNSNFTKSLSIILDLPAKCDTKDNIDSLVTEYMEGRYKLNDYTLNGFLELLGDAVFIHPTYKLLESNINSSRDDFGGIIKFDYRGPYSFSKIYSNSLKDFGTAHADDSLFLFEGPRGVSHRYPKRSPEAALVKRYVRLFQSFASTGYADIQECTDNDFPNNCNYLSIVNDDDEPFQTGNTWNTKRMNIWDKNPEEAELWDGTDCIPRNNDSALKPITGSENCLYLNIYRPLQRADGKLPVMFYIPAYRLGPFDDLLFLFEGPRGVSHRYPKRSPEAALVKRYVRLFQTFASTGHTGIQECNDFPNNCNYLSIVDDDEPFQTGNTWNTQRMNIWDDVFSRIFTSIFRSVAVMKGILLWLTFLVFYSNVGPIKASLPKVCFDGLSCVLGRYMSGYDSYSFEAFLGIPYAKPPIGNLRFSNPEEAELWDGTVSALYPKPDCIQRDYISELKPITGSEDCLYLNIYRPLHRAGGKLPVMFYIHGGGFFSGSPSPDSVGPQYFMDTNDVILVVPAYRLGPFGFLSTNDTEMTGNFGLKDQNLALKWVNKYISAFGGDPNSVTIFGHSAGAAAVHLHLVTRDKKASPLFHNAVMMSGVANSPFAVPLSDPRGQVIKLAKAAGVSEAEYLSSAGLVQALRSIKPKTLLRAVDDLKLWNVYPFVTFRPNIENVNWPGAFLTKEQDTKDPQIPFGMCHEVPWFVGNVPAKGEGLVVALRLATDKKLRKDFNSNFNKSLSNILDLPAKCDTKDNIALLVTEYMGDSYELNDYTLNGFLELLGDAYFIYPTYKLLASNINSSRDDFRGIINFDYRGPYSYSKIFSNSLKDFGTTHADDSLFLFEGPRGVSHSYSKRSPEAALVKRYVRLFQTFASTGHAGIQECNDFPNNCNYLSILDDDEPFQTGNTWNTQRMNTWDKVYQNC
ncbi:uncharacterized protein LOC105209246 [Zeugodacus cucurbitae]|uniref:uncharacterized protein LOC105209246 n=1 Tax=Zeugodacus cucurbitae TaxID=28588 RepID=UPI0023D9263D|nr:uncharacterized protein LOC105209246 [Zeugodacus cucurbitae]